MKNYFLRPNEATVLGAFHRRSTITLSELAVESGLAPTEIERTITMLTARGLTEETTGGVALTADGDIARRLAGPDRYLATFAHATPDSVFVVDDDAAELADSLSDEELNAALDAEIGQSETSTADNSKRGEGAAE